MGPVKDKTRRRSNACWSRINTRMMNVAHEDNDPANGEADDCFIFQERQKKKTSCSAAWAASVDSKCFGEENFQVDNA